MSHSGIVQGLEQPGRRGRRLDMASVGALLLLGIAFALNPSSLRGKQSQNNSLDKVYADESHCLIGPEIRSGTDGPNSCYCRDAIADARYVWHTYLITGRDPNLDGAELTLQINAKQMCGYDVYKIVEADDWKWNGPEVVRTYPPDDVIRQIKPDNQGIIHYDYTVVILQRDSNGRVIKSQSFTARDMVPVSLLNKTRKPPKPKP